MKKFVLMTLAFALAFTFVGAMADGSDRTEDVTISFKDPRSESFAWSIDTSCELDQYGSGAINIAFSDVLLKSGNGIKLSYTGGELTSTSDSSVKVTPTYAWAGSGVDASGYVDFGGSTSASGISLSASLNISSLPSLIYEKYTGTVTVKAAIAALP